MTDRRGRLALAMTAAAGLVAAGVLAVSPTSGPALIPGFTPELWIYFGCWDSAGQRRAHQLGLIAIAAGVLVAPFLARWLHGPAGNALDRRLRPVHDAALAGVLAAVPLLWIATGAWGVFVAVVGGSLAAAWALGRLPRVDPATFWPIVLGLGLCYLVPGLLTTVDLSKDPPFLLGETEFHYSMVVDPGRKLAHGFALFTQTKAAYGVIMPLVVAVVERIFGPWSAGTWLHAVRWSQFVVLGLLIAAYLRRSRGDRGRALLPTVIAVSAFNSFTPAMVEPNQSGWRFLALLGAPLAIDLAGGLAPTPRAAALGGLAGYALLHNVETGIPVTLGVIAYLYFRHGWAGLPFGRVAADLGAFVGAAGAVVAAFLVAWRAVLGAWPDLLAPEGLFSDVLGFSRGFGGLPWYVDPLAIGVLAHAAYALLRVAATGRAPLGHDKAFRAGISTVILVWFAYFANRPHPYNLATFVALWGFLLVDVVPILRRAAGRRRVAPALVLVYGLGIPAALHGFALSTPAAAIAATRIRSGPARPDAVTVGRIVVSPDAAAVIARRADRVRREAAHGEVWYFTADSWLIPSETGVYPPYPLTNVFSDMTTTARWDALVALVGREAPPRLLFDDGSAPASGNPMAVALMARLRRELSGDYALVAIEDGWFVMDRRPEAPSPTR
jgi:hypothetical protein